MKRSWALLLLLGISAASALGSAILKADGGLQGEYVADQQWGRVARSRVDRQISTAALDRAWSYSPPSEFRAQWTGFLVVDQPGWYTFATTSDDGSTLTIDGLLVVDNSGDHAPRTRTGIIRLIRGPHPVLVQYSQAVGDFEIALSWARDDEALSTIPDWAWWREPTSYWRARAVRFFTPIPYVAFGAFAVLALWTAYWEMRRRMVTPLHVDWALVLILLFAAYFRLQYIELPMADAHGWRQIFNADVARNFNEESLNIWYPRVSWGGGGDSRVSMEFPLLQWIAAVCFRLLGERDIVCRSIVIVFSLATIIGLYGLGRTLWNRAVGRGAAFLYAVSPSAIFFGRTFISDTPMVCFSVFGVWGFALYFQTGKRAPLVWGTAAAALACLVKLPAVVIFAPIAVLAWQGRRWRLLSDRPLVTGVLTILLLTVIWYAHAESVFLQTGLGVAIWHPVGGYTADIMEVAGPITLVTSWNTVAQLKTLQFYSIQLERLWNLHLTPLGTAVMLIGAVAFWRSPHRRFVDAWFAAVVLFILVAAEGNRWHEFYQLPLLLPAALYFGLAARPVFDGEWLGRFVPYRLGGVVAAIALAAIAVEGFDRSRAVSELFRPTNLRLRPVRMGQRLQSLTPPGALLVTVEYEQFGGNSPVILYHARRRGWSFDSTSITPEVIKRLQTRYGAKYFVTLIWSDIIRRRPEVAAYLQTQENIPVDASDVALFALR